MPTESTFFLAGLFLLLAAAGWAMGRFGERDEEDAPPPLNVDYLKGLNFLLNEQTDQALEHFLEMVRGVFLKGTGYAVLWKQFVILAAMAVAGLWFATVRFTRSIR